MNPDQRRNRVEDWVSRAGCPRCPRSPPATMPRPRRACPRSPPTYSISPASCHPGHVAGSLPNHQRAQRHPQRDDMHLGIASGFSSFTAADHSVPAPTASRITPSASDAAVSKRWCPYGWSSSGIPSGCAGWPAAPQSPTPDRTANEYHPQSTYDFDNTPTTICAVESSTFHHHTHPGGRNPPPRARWAKWGIVVGFGVDGWDGHGYDQSSIQPMIRRRPYRKISARAPSGMRRLAGRAAPGNQSRQIFRQSWHPLRGFEANAVTGTTRRQTPMRQRIFCVVWLSDGVCQTVPTAFDESSGLHARHSWRRHCTILRGARIRRRPGCWRERRYTQRGWAFWQRLVAVQPPLPPAFRNDM